MEKKILNFDKQLLKMQKSIHQAEQVMEQTVILERDLINIKEQNKDLQRENAIRKERERLMGLSLLLSNICWLVLFMLILFKF